MFESIGVHADLGAGKRRSLSMAITTFLASCGTTTLALWGAFTLPQPEPEPLPEPALYEVMLGDEAPPDLVKPDAPVHRPRGGSARRAGGPAEATVPDKPPQTEVAPEDPKTLPPIVDTTLRSATRLSGPGDGPGTKDGVGLADVGSGSSGLGDGDGIGGSGGGRRTVHHADLQWKRQLPKPSYPLSAKGMNIGEQLCTVAIDFDANGVPERIQVERCLSVFHESVEQALQRWRVYPPRVGKVSLPSRTRLKVRFIEQ